MQLTKSQIRALQALQQDTRWDTLELYITNYLKENFLQQTVKRDSEFDTVWWMAYNEGGKFHIQKLFKQLEDDCLKDL